MVTLSIYPRCADRQKNFYQDFKRQHDNALAILKDNPNATVSYKYQKNKKYTVDDIYTAIGQAYNILFQAYGIPSIIGSKLFHDTIYTQNPLALEYQQHDNGVIKLKATYDTEKSPLILLSAHHNSDVVSTIITSQINKSFASAINKFLVPLFKKIDEDNFEFDDYRDNYYNYPHDLMDKPSFNPRLNMTWQSLLAQQYIKDYKQEQSQTQLAKNSKKQVDNIVDYNSSLFYKNHYRKNIQSQIVGNATPIIALDKKDFQNTTLPHFLLKTFDGIQRVILSSMILPAHEYHYCHSFDKKHVVQHSDQLRLYNPDNAKYCLSTQTSGLQRSVSQPYFSIPTRSMNADNDYSYHNEGLDYALKSNAKRQHIENCFSDMHQKGHFSYRLSGSQNMVALMLSTAIPHKNFKGSLSQTFLDLAFNFILDGGHSFSDVSQTVKHSYSVFKIADICYEKFLKEFSNCFSGDVIKEIKYSHNNLLEYLNKFEKEFGLQSRKDSFFDKDLDEMLNHPFEKNKSDLSHVTKIEQMNGIKHLLACYCKQLSHKFSLFMDKSNNNIDSCISIDNNKEIMCRLIDAIKDDKTLHQMSVKALHAGLTGKKIN